MFHSSAAVVVCSGNGGFQCYGVQFAAAVLNTQAVQGRTTIELLSGAEQPGTDEREREHTEHRMRIRMALANSSTRGLRLSCLSLVFFGVT